VTALFDHAGLMIIANDYDESVGVCRSGPVYRCIPTSPSATASSAGGHDTVGTSGTAQTMAGE